MHLRPLHDRVVVRRIEADEKTAGGIIIPDTAREKPMEGEVVAVGPGARNEQGQLMPPDLKAGDSIIFESTTPHRLINKGSHPMRAVWVVLNQH